MTFSEMGDRLFNELAEQMVTAHPYRLLFEHKLKPELFEQVQRAVAGYVSACLDCPLIVSEVELIERLMAVRGKLVNHTGTGLLMPKRGQALAFNLGQKSVADAFSQLGGNDLIDAVDLPVNVRMVYGQMNPANLKLPFTSTKLHSDGWAGVHSDAIVVVLPVFGDIDNITIEAGEMPREMELGAMRVMSDFDEGRDIPKVIAYSDAQLQHGKMYFNDARGLHQMVRRVSEGVRISIDFRFRRKFNEAYRSMIPSGAMESGIEEDNCIPYEEWLKVGRDLMIVFDETMAEATAKRQGSAPVPLYTKGCRLVDLF
ncbi:hypothetical protein [Leptolyngbya sp. NIES-2104]|uniref:hypothetical protein n=1 Tax=Leptolyngbya sp. NIES-2104 TaxID=1552121 RepID=UPI0006ECBEFE|nr:hypothetical protein [Leptolyngbya sp. NIES-2104]GAP97516.1 hypothetical protein NIES2104_40630 [Leptolyngbya sp. NIES-2104]